MDKETRDSLRDELDERGARWQIVGFVTVGIVATTVLAVYSGSDSVPLRFLDVATSKLSWAFVPAFAYGLDRSRTMFERRSDIRKSMMREGLERGREEGIAVGEKMAEERLREWLKSAGICLSPEEIDRLFKHTNGKAS